MKRVEKATGIRLPATGIILKPVARHPSPLKNIVNLIQIAMHLTKAEEQIMQILWDMENGIVKDIRLRFSDPKTCKKHSLDSCESTGKERFRAHKAYGNTHLYYPLVSKEEYSKSQLFRLLDGYFNNSFPALASFFARGKGHVDR